MDSEGPIIIERGNLTERIVEEHKKLGGDSSLSLFSETRYHVRQNGRTLIDFGRVEGIIRLHLEYHELPVPIKMLALGLEQRVYKIEYFKRS